VKSGYGSMKKDRVKQIDKALKDIDPQVPAELDVETRRIEKIGQGLLGLKEGEATQQKEMFDALVRETQEKMLRGEFSKEDFDFLVNHAGVEVPMDARVVNIGMEWGLELTGGLNKDNVNKPENIEKYFDAVNTNVARIYARERVAEDTQVQTGQLLSWEVKGGADLPSSMYHSSIHKLDSVLGGVNIVSKESAIPQRAGVAELELRPLPANSTGTGKLGWPYPHLPWVQRDPELKRVLATRDSYYRYTDQRRADTLTKNLSRAFKEGELTTAIVSTGVTNAGVTKKMLDTFMKENPKATSYDVEYQRGTSQASRTRGRIIDVDGTGTKFIYDLGKSVSAQGLSTDNAAASLLQERDRILQRRAKKLTERMK
jgi:hypothetical protein